MERIIYEEYATNTEDLKCKEENWDIFIGKNDKIIGTKLTGIRFKKEEDDLNDKSLLKSSCELTLTFSNGSDLEIYFDSERNICIKTD